MSDAALAAINAGFNAASGTLLFTGWMMIRRGNRSVHRLCMLGAVTASSLFLIGYVVRVLTHGTMRFGGAGLIKGIYLTILFSHMILAMAVVPLVIVTLTRALRERFDRHRAIARWTFPIWAYVSVTGVVVYFMLYHLPR